MDIFKVLQLGNSSIKEVNVTAFLGYFLNPHEDHSMGDELLRELISIIDNDNANNIILEEYSNSEINIEYKNMDTLIKLFNEGKEEFHRIIIENKIKNTYDPEQLIKYYTSQREATNNGISITVLFITHENCNDFTNQVYKGLEVKKGDSKKHIYWSTYDNSSKEYENSIYKSLTNIIEKKRVSRKDQIDSYELETIKSFSIFLNSFCHVPRTPLNTDVLLRMERYETVRRQNELRDELRQNYDLNFDDVDTQDKRFPKFCHKINGTFKVCIQLSNREDPTIRVLLRMIDNTQPEPMFELCRNEESLEHKTGTQHYAVLVGKAGSAKAVDKANFGNDSIVSLIKQYQEIIVPRQ